MKKYLSFILALVMIATYMVIPTMAVSPVDVEKEVQKINDVYIPTTAERVQEGTATVYYNFYDSVNDMHYAFYNSETGEHFAMSGPRHEVVTTADARAREVVAHEYSFSGRFTINGKDNGHAFTLPGKTVYITGDAALRRMADNTDRTDKYDEYTYTIEVKQDKFLFPQSKKFTGIAGDGISGSFTAKEDTYYLIITPVDRIEDGDYINGNGKLYYYV